MCCIEEGCDQVRRSPTRGYCPTHRKAAQPRSNVCVVREAVLFGAAVGTIVVGPVMALAGVGTHSLYGAVMGTPRKGTQKSKRAHAGVGARPLCASLLRLLRADSIW
jgi:hypothetical protein